MVQCIEGDIKIGGDDASQLDRPTDMGTVHAERPVAAFHDGQAHGAVLVDLCNATC